MASKTFEIGDRVRVNENFVDDAHPNAELVGKIGVIAVSEGYNLVGVRFPGWREGHGLDGKGKKEADTYNGWYVGVKSLTRVVAKTGKKAK